MRYAYAVTMLFGSYETGENATTVLVIRSTPAKGDEMKKVFQEAEDSLLDILKETESVILDYDYHIDSVSCLGPFPLADDVKVTDLFHQDERYIPSF